jgi:hypothetical protein
MGGEKIAPIIDETMTERLQDNELAFASIFGIIIIVWIC